MTSVCRFAVRALSLALVTFSSWSWAAAFDVIATPTSPYPGGGTWVSQTTNIPVTLAEFDTATSVTDGDLIVTFSDPLQAFVVPDSWGSWDTPPETESDSPRVLWTQGLATLRLSFDQPLDAFGFELQPNELATFDFTANFQFLGFSVGQITRSVDGDAGARLFAGVSTIDAPFTDVLISSGGADFAIAQLRYHVVPEPTTSVLAALLVLCGAATLRLRKSKRIA